MMNVTEDSFLDRIGMIDKGFETRLRLEQKSHFEHVRNKKENRKRSDDGRLIITNKIANNYSSNGLNLNDFRKHLSSNFEDNFLITVDNLTPLKRLINKIVRSTNNYPESIVSSKIIGEIIYQISDELLQDICQDPELLSLIETANQTAYNYLIERCRDWI